VPQELAYNSDLSTLDTARFYARLKRAPASRSREVLAEVGLAEHADKPVGALSGGMKQRLALGLALLTDPPVLVLDEPTDGLDPNQKHEVRELIRRMAPEKAIVISTHILEEVDAVCTRAIIIARGKVLADATPRELEAPGKTLEQVFRDLTLKQEAA
jgi:ABC-2 type transport system ATP-binding protein